MAIKTSIPKGTRDFTPVQMIRRNYIFDTIKEVFNRYGFLPIETPAIENLSTLLGKYGMEGEKLIFKILNSGDFLENIDFNTVDKNNLKAFTSLISEKALHYDLTVPFARFVVMHKNEIDFPFKRYQVQTVWRADKPQKGRYREFYQCDADVIGSKSLLNEIELVQLISEVFHLFEMKVVILINNRKILQGISEAIGMPDKFSELTSALDKIDKIGINNALENLCFNGFSDNSLELLKKFLDISGDNKQKLLLLNELLENSVIGKEGIKETDYIMNFCCSLNIKSEIKFEPTLARGLNYYTGTIFEVVPKDIPYSSVCGGGRYDDLTGIFGLENMSGVGISFGADRIFDILEKLNLFPEDFVRTPKIMLINFGNSEVEYSMKMLVALRDAGISAELYPDEDKISKQMNYADRKGVKYVLFIGNEERENNVLKVKDMKTREQRILKFEELIAEFFI
jgi:histidyl-tRNA synthetase